MFLFDENDARAVRRTAINIALVAAALAIWMLRSAMLLVFAAVLFAIMLDGLAGLLRRRLRIGPGAALTVVLVMLSTLAGLTMWLFGAQIVDQFNGLARRLPGAWLALQRQLTEWGVFDEAVAQVRKSVPSAGAVLGFLSGVFSGLGTVLGGVGLALVGGIYLAASPKLYRDGLIGLWPQPRRARVSDTLDALGLALKAWLLGQVVSMVAIGALITLGLWVIGLPSFLALGLIAGLVQFVPFAGSFLAAIPGLLVALTQGPGTLAWTVVVYIGVQQLDSNVISPLVQRRVASLPPALIIFTVVVFGLLLGAIGVALAVPLTVVVYVLVGKLWVRDTLGDAVKLPGER